MDLEYKELLWVLEAEEGDKDAQKARAKRYGISVKANGHVTKPAKYDDVANTKFLDPVNFRYPADPAHLSPALSYFNQSDHQSKGGYSDEEWAKMGKKLARLLGEGYSYSSESKTVERATSAEETDFIWHSPFLVLEGTEEMPEWIAIHKLCDRPHPTYGTVKMTEPMMDSAVENFRKKVLRPSSPMGLQVPIDVRHKGDRALGWLDDMKKALPYLAGKPNWNELGQQTVQQREFMYVSPVYAVSAERGVVVKEVTLTNRDFLKMPPVGTPIILSDDFEPDIIYPVTWNSGGNRMTKPKQDPTPPADDGADDDPQQMPTPAVQLTEDQLASLTALAEQAQAEKDRRVALEIRLQKTEAALLQVKEQGKKDEVAHLIEKAGKRGVTAFTLNWARPILLSLPRTVPEDGQIELEVPSGEETKKEKMSLYGAIAYLLENIPALVPIEERTFSDPGQPPGGGDEDEAELEEMAVELAGHMRLPSNNGGDDE